MEIKASCKLNYQAVKALTHLTMFKKADPKKRMVLWMSLAAFALGMVAASMLAFDVAFEEFFWQTLAVVVAASFMLYLYFVLPRTQYKALAAMKEVENRYIFCDDTIKVFTVSEEYDAQGEMDYHVLAKVYQTSAYLFLFQTKRQAFIVDRSTLDSADDERVRNKLHAALQQRYVICKY